jgi:hypothetical protein
MLYEATRLIALEAAQMAAPVTAHMVALKADCSAAQMDAPMVAQWLADRSATQMAALKALIALLSRRLPRWLP